MNKLSKKTMSRGLWTYIFFLIAIEPAAFQNFSIISKIYDVAQIAMFIVCTFFFFSRLTIKDMKNKRICLLMAIYYIYFLLITYINHGLTRNLAFQAIHFIGFAFYLDIVIKNNPKEIFKSVLNILTLYVFLNCVIVWLMPDGLYKTDYFSNNFLLGYDNQNINFILPAMVLVLLKNQYYKKCIRQIIFTYSIAWLTSIKIWSGMTLCIVSLMTVVAFFYLRTQSGFIQKRVFTDKIFNGVSLLIINLIVNISLVILRLQFFFDYIIVAILHKDLTLTNRTYIWDKTLMLIKEQPIFGYGKEEFTSRAIKYGVSSNSPYGLHAHNRLLETLYSGGIIMFLLFIFIMFYAVWCLNRYRKANFSKILSIAIFMYLVGMLSEYYDYCIFFWGFFIIAENANCYCE